MLLFLLHLKRLLCRCDLGSKTTDTTRLGQRCLERRDVVGRGKLLLGVLLLLELLLRRFDLGRKTTDATSLRNICLERRDITCGVVNGRLELETGGVSFLFTIQASSQDNDLCKGQGQ